MTASRLRPIENGPAFDVDRIRGDFPILDQPIHGKPLIFLDSAASAQKPQQVLQVMDQFYRQRYANVHRGVYELSAQATDAYESARQEVANFLNAAKADEIVFTKGATEAINLVAHSYGRRYLRAGDEIILSLLEHHANIIPWQILRDEIGVTLKIIPITEDGNIDLPAFEKLFGPRTRLVAITHVSNAIGTIVPVKTFIDKAHQIGAHVLIDGCQAAPFMPVDVRELDCDFYVFSGHKTYGPTGIGVLFGKEYLLTSLPPYQTGGNMIRRVTMEKTSFADSPQRFEAGTPNIVGAVGLAAALRYMQDIGMDAIAAHEQALETYGRECLSAIPGLRLLGKPDERAGVLSFFMDGMHPHDLGTILDSEGIAVRAGHHCAQPLMDFFGIAGAVRASFGIYNRFDECDRLADAILKAKEIFG